MSAAGDTLSSRSHKNERFIRIELSVRKQAPVINVASCVPVCRLWAELYSRTRVAPAWPEEGTAVGGGNESYLLSKGIRKISMDIIARDESGYRVEPPRRLELCPWLFAAHRTTNKRNSTCAYMIDTWWMSHDSINDQKRCFPFVDPVNIRRDRFAARVIVINYGGRISSWMTIICTTGFESKPRIENRETPLLCDACWRNYKKDGTILMNKRWGGLLATRGTRWIIEKTCRLISLGRDLRDDP